MKQRKLTSNKRKSFHKTTPSRKRKKIVKKVLNVEEKENQPSQMMDRIRYLLGKIIESVQYVEFNLSIAYQYNLIINSLNKLLLEKSKITQEEFTSITQKASQLKDKLNNITFGQLIVTISSANIFSDKDLNELTDILSTRNKLVHQYFKVNDFEEQSSNPSFLEGQINYLSKFNNRINNFNDMLFKTIEDTKNKLSTITISK